MQVHPNVESADGTPAAAFGLPSSARLVALLALSCASCLALAMLASWIEIPSQLQVALARCVTPLAAVGSASLCVALVAKAYCRSYLRYLAVVFALVAAATALLGAARRIESLPEPTSLTSLFAPLSRLNITYPLATITSWVILATALVTLTLTQDENRQPGSFFLPIVSSNLLACLVGSLASVVRSMMDAQVNDGILMTPGAACVLLLLNVSMLLRWYNNDAIRMIFSRSTGSSLVFWVVAKFAISLCGCALIRVELQKHHFITLEEGVALVVASAIGLAVWYGMQLAKAFNRVLAHNVSIQTSLQRLMTDNRVMLDRIDCENSRLHALLQAAESYSIIATDVHGTVTLFNHGAERMLGYATAEVVGKMTPVPFHELSEVEDRAQAIGVKPGFAVFTLLPNSGLCDQRTWTYRHKDGTRIPVLLAVHAIRDKNERVTGYVGIARDLREELKVHRDRDEFLKIGQELLCVADLTGRLRCVSPSFSSLLGYRPDEVLHHQFADFVHPDDLTHTQAAMKQLMDGRSLSRFENRWRDKNGRYHWISWDVSVPNSDTTFYASGWDVTRDKEREHQLQTHLDFEKHLVGIVSHDLRNPLSAIGMCAEVIQKRPDSRQRVIKSAERITKAVKKAETLVHDLLDFTQARLGGGLHIHVAPCNVSDIINVCVEEQRLLHSDCQISCNIEPGLHITADGPRVEQVVSNLLSNAVKYSDGSVALDAKTDATTLYVSIWNDGAPIPSQLIPELFEPMQRGANKTENLERSVGLGLYIVREAVKAHGGSLDVESSASQGTRFTVAIPQTANRA